MVIVHELLLQQEELVVQHVLTVTVLHHNPERLHKAMQTVLQVCISLTARFHQLCTVNGICNWFRYDGIGWIRHHQVVCGCDAQRLCAHSVLGVAMRHKTDRQTDGQTDRQTDTVGTKFVWQPLEVETFCLLLRRTQRALRESYFARAQVRPRTTCSLAQL